MAAGKKDTKPKSECPPLAFTEDSDLIRRAELWATGATIHNTKNTIGAYRAALVGASTDSAPPAWRLYMLALAGVYAARLEAYMRHGDYSRANRENPQPLEPLPPDASPEALAEFHRWTLYAAKQWLYEVGERGLAATLSPVIQAAMRRMGH